ncbi:hypothetical protein QUF72_05420, partial [Desulfobacterales bacterium HSG2]|nr:hypothetical protein [Desulfobacterales bacterium HSG2]
HSDPESTNPVIPGRMSEAGSSQTLVNSERGFRHSDPESMCEFTGFLPSSRGIAKSPSLLSYSDLPIRTGQIHPSSRGIAKSPPSQIATHHFDATSQNLSFRAGCRKPVFPRPWLTQKPASGILTRNPQSRLKRLHIQF